MIMRPVHLIQAMIFIAGGFLIFFSYAENAPQHNATFLSSCVDSWMKKVDQSSDKLDFKNFGEKYCACAATQPLDNDDAVKKAISLCMSRTVLHDTMNTMEEELGLSEARDKDFHEYCLDTWELVYPKQSVEDKKTIIDYCTCAAPKLMKLIKQTDTITDRQYDDDIDVIADSCTGTANNNANTQQTGAAPEKI